MSYTTSKFRAFVLSAYSCYFGFLEKCSVRILIKKTGLDNVSFFIVILLPVFVWRSPSPPRLSLPRSIHEFCVSVSNISVIKSISVFYFTSDHRFLCKRLNALFALAYFGRILRTLRSFQCRRIMGKFTSN